jgi:hypothetical protein
MAVLGELGEFDVSGILQLLSSRRATGLLRLTFDGDEVAFYLQAGRFVRFESVHVPLRLGRLLQQRALISQRQLEEALRVQAQGSHRQSLGEIVVARGWATPAQVTRCHYDQQVTALARAISAKRGTFGWHSGETPDDESELFAVDVHQLVIDAMARVREIATLRRGLPGPHAVLATSERVDVTITPFNAAEQRIIDALRAGITTWGELLDVLPLDEAQLLSTLADLLRRKLVVSGYMAVTGELMATGGPALGETDLAKLLGQPVGS